MLKYIGTGSIPGVPAQDLTDNEITRLASDFKLSEQDFVELMILRGLYEKPPKKKRIKPVEENE